MILKYSAGLAVFLTIVVASQTVSAQRLSCGKTSAGFNKWANEYRQKAGSFGISKNTLNAAFKNVSYDKKIIRIDRTHSSFHLTFEQFYKRRAAGIVNRAKSRLKTHHCWRKLKKDTGYPRK